MTRGRIGMPEVNEFRLGVSDFRILQDVVGTIYGIELVPSQRTTIERKLRDRVAILGLDGFGEYVRCLRDARGRGELEEAIDLLTTNETYFFREEYQLQAFRDEVVPMLARSAQGRQHLSVWSAGCSTGEEPYSIAIMLLEAAELSGYDLRVFGSDVSRRCITHARRAVYGPSSFRATPPEVKRKWFVDRPDGLHVHDRARSLCHFGHVNLLDAERVATVGRVDAIFCRNVLIYLHQAARRRVIDLFHERLYPGGILFLGHSESLLNVSTAFELLHLRTDLVYRRPLQPPRSRGTPALERQPTGPNTDSPMIHDPADSDLRGAAVPRPNRGTS